MQSPGEIPCLCSEGPTTILSYGALMSQPSARLTFPDLRNFRLVRVRGYRRVFASPHLFLIRRGVVDPHATLRLATLSAEPVPKNTDKSNCNGGSEGGAMRRTSFVAAAFEVELDAEQRAAFVAREPEYAFAAVPFEPLSPTAVVTEPGAAAAATECSDDNLGVLCIASTDAALRRHRRIGAPADFGLSSIWHWHQDSGLLPCDVYLRHVLLAVRKAGAAAEESFMEDTLLCDRRTTLAQYLATSAQQDAVMCAEPPLDLAARFNG